MQVSLWILIINMMLLFLELLHVVWWNVYGWFILKYVLTITFTDKPNSCTPLSAQPSVLILSLVVYRYIPLTITATATPRVPPRPWALLHMLLVGFSSVVPSAVWLLRCLHTRGFNDCCVCVFSFCISVAQRLLSARAVARFWARTAGAGTFLCITTEQKN